MDDEEIAPSTTPPEQPALLATGVHRPISRKTPLAAASKFCERDWLGRSGRKTEDPEIDQSDAETTPD